MSKQRDEDETIRAILQTIVQGRAATASDERATERCVEVLKLAVSFLLANEVDVSALPVLDGGSPAVVVLSALPPARPGSRSAHLGRLAN